MGIERIPVVAGFGQLGGKCEVAPGGEHDALQLVVIVVLVPLHGDAVVGCPLL